MLSMTKYGLRAQVIAYTILPTIIIGGLLASYFSFHRYQQANEYLINRAINISEPLAIASEYGIVDETRTILRRLTSATHRKNSQMIKSIAIFDVNNKLFVTSNFHRNFNTLRLKEGVNIPEVTEISNEHDSIIVRSPIIDETNFLEYQLTFEQPRKIIGYVALEVNKDEIELLLYRDTVLSFFVVLLGILGSLYVAFKQAKRITAPISQMASVVEKISLGHLNARVEGEYSGEIALLQEGINEMAISHSQHHEEMQESIDLATSELRETLDQMEIQNIELDITRKKAQQAALVKSEFLANMSHELRTPLNGVIGFAQQLLKTRLNHNQIDYLKTIEGSAGNLLNIINDILDFSKLEANKFKLEHIPFNLCDTINETLHLLAPSVHEKNLEISMMIDSNVPSELVGDAMRLQQILTNLISNAIKFTRKGNIEIQIQRIDESDEVDEENKISLKMMISDTGIGISEKQQAQLFKAFTQADTSITRQYGGTGLGLVITQKLVELMNGSIDLVSTPNQGSTFWFTIEIEKRPHSPLTYIPEENIQQSVLVYERNEYAGRACTQLLNQWGFDLSYARTQHHWDTLLNKQYDSIIIGYSRCNNLEPLFKLIKEARKFTRNIVLLINSSDPSIYEQLLGTNANHCLSKPINHKNLANALLSEKPIATNLNKKLTLTRKDINVMAVDDNPANLKLITAMLSDRVHHLSTCIDGQQAVDLAQEQPFDLIFMDIQMPVLDGISACMKIKSEGCNQQTPIIAVTAHILHNEKELFLKRGMDDCLEKPIDETALQSIINKWTHDKPVLGDIKISLDNQIMSLTDADSPQNISFNQELALQRAAGKENLAKEMLTMLLQEFEPLTEEVNKALDAEIDNVHFAQIIHKFHGGCSYCGVPKLSKITDVITKELKQGISPELLEPELLELLDELKNVQNEIQEYLS